MTLQEPSSSTAREYEWAPLQFFVKPSSLVRHNHRRQAEPLKKTSPGRNNKELCLSIGRSCLGTCTILCQLLSTCARHYQVRTEKHPKGGLICIYVCSMCICTDIHVYVYIYIHIHLHVSRCICMRVCIYIHIYIYSGMRVFACACVCACPCQCATMCAPVSVLHLQVHVHVYVCVFVCVYVYVDSHSNRLMCLWSCISIGKSM